MTGNNETLQGKGFADPTMERVENKGRVSNASPPADYDATWGALWPDRLRQQGRFCGDHGVGR